MDGVSKAIELAALPSNEWRALSSAMSYYLRHALDGSEHQAIARHFPEGMPRKGDWVFISDAVNNLRLQVDEAAAAGKQLNRNEYMRLYMRRLRQRKRV